MFDTDCMIATVSHPHRNHVAALDEYNRRIGHGETMVVAAHSLAEAYSVLTRSPAPLQVSASYASAVLEDTFVSKGELISLDGSEYAALLHSLPARGVTGGLVYDAIIAACAEKANVDVFLTFNERHFRLVTPAGIVVTAPRANQPS
jgi:predicted nucleic acid-binding protein